MSQRQNGKTMSRKPRSRKPAPEPAPEPTPQTNGTPGPASSTRAAGEIRRRRGRSAPAPEPTPADPGSAELVMTPASEGKVERTEWLWPDRLEWGSVAIVQGEKGAGKSTWMRAVAADVTGGPRLPGAKGKPRVAGNVLWFAGEEPVWRIVRPGLTAAQADLSYCYLSDAMGEDSHTLRLPGDCDRLTALIRRSGAVLVVIDPVFAFLDGSLDIMGDGVAARQFVRRLMIVCAQTGALVLLARNLVKGSGQSALDAGRGNGELGNAVRSVLHVQTLPQATGVYGLSVAACNSGRKVPTLTYSITDSGGAGIISVAGQSELTADELASGESGDLDRSQLTAAMALIKQLLGKEEVDSRIVRAKAEAAMISTRTLQLAAQRLGVTYRRDGRRDTLTTYWLPPVGGWK